MFKHPLLKILRALAPELASEYKNQNPQRHAFIALYDELNKTIHSYSSKNISNVLLGAAVFELEIIQGEYSYLSAERSQMDGLLLKKLGITPDNPLRDEERLYYLQQFSHYVDKIMTEENMEQVNDLLNKKNREQTWKDKNALKETIHLMLKQVRERHSKHISQLVHATPELNVLRKEIESLPRRYQEAQKERGILEPNADREAIERIIKLIDGSFSHFYSLEECDKIIPLQKREHDARVGLILYALLDIKSTCRFFPPEGGPLNHGSDFFNLSLSSLNRKRLKDIPYAYRIKMLEALMEHIKIIKDETSYFNEQALLWKNKGFDLEKELAYLYSNLKSIRDYEEVKKNKPSYAAWGIAALTSFATKTGVEFVATEFGLLTGGASLGFAVYLGGLVSAGVITKAAAYLYGCLLDKMGEMAGDEAKDLLKRLIESHENSEQIRRQLTVEDEEVLVRLVNTLLVLPNDIMADDEKNSIRKVFGLGMEEALKPVKRLPIAEEARFFAHKFVPSLTVTYEDYHPVHMIN